MFGRVNATPMATRRSWGWFAAWWLVGALWSFTFLAVATVGLFVLPSAMAATAILVWRSHGSGLIGLLSGLGIPVFYVAYLNRGGPGNVCSAIAGGQSCAQEWSPWPWLGVAIPLTVAGLLIFRYRRVENRPKSDKFWHPA